MQLWFSKLVPGSPEQFMRKEQLLLNHISQFNDSPRHATCMLSEQQNQVKHGRLKTGNFLPVMCLYPTDVLPPQWMFVHTSLVKSAVQLMQWVWTGWTLWVKRASNRKKQGKVRGFCTVPALAVLSPFAGTFKKSVAISYCLCARKCIFYVVRIFWSGNWNLKSFLA